MRVHHRWISALLLPCYLSACTSWHRETAPLPDILAAEPGTKLRVTLTYGQRMTLTDAQQVGDSVVGKMTLTAEQVRELGVRDRHLRVAIALADIQGVERTKTDPIKTVAVIPVLGLMGLVAAWAIHCAFSKDDFICGNY